MKKKVSFYYPIQITVDEDGYYAEVPDLPGCSTSGETFEGLMSNVQEAIASYLGSLRKHGEPIPAPSRKRVSLKGGFIYTSIPRSVWRHVRRKEKGGPRGSKCVLQWTRAGKEG